MTLKSPEEFLRHGTAESFSPSSEKVSPIRSNSPFRIEVKWAENVPPPISGQYLIKGVIEPRQVSIWFGPPGSAKTALLLHVAHGVAQGRPLFGRRVRQGNTLYLALEGRGGLDKRIYALCKRFSGAPGFGYSGTPVSMLTTSDGAHVRVNAEHVQGLVDTVRKHDIALVIIDTLNLTLDGADENSNTVVGMLVRAAAEVYEATGTHVAFIAHAPKHGVEGGPRGGGAQLGNADVVVAITSEDGVFTASTAPPGGKIKDGPPFRLRFRLNADELLTDPDGDAITSCTVEELPDEAEPTPRKKMTAELEGAYGELLDLFLAIGPDPKIVPIKGMSACRCVTKAEVNAQWTKAGRLDTEADTPSANQKKAQRLRVKLKDLGKIGMTEKYVWLVDTPDTGGH